MTAASEKGNISFILIVTRLFNEYRSFHQIRNERKGGGLCISLRESYTYKQRSDLNINSDAIECLCIEILNKHSKDLLLNLSYRPAQRDTILFEKNLQDYC